MVPDTAAVLGLGAPACCLPEGRPVRLLQEREDVRGGAIFLYGNVIYSGGRRYQQALRRHAFWSLVPLLFHLADSCPAVVMVSVPAMPLARQRAPESPGLAWMQDGEGPACLRVCRAAQEDSAPVSGEQGEAATLERPRGLAGERAERDQERTHPGWWFPLPHPSPGSPLPYPGL